MQNRFLDAKVHNLITQKTELAYLENQYYDEGDFVSAAEVNDNLFYVCMQLLAKNTSNSDDARLERAFITEVIKNSFYYQAQLNNQEEKA